MFQMWSCSILWSKELTEVTIYSCNLCEFGTTDQDVAVRHMLKEHPVETMLAIKGEFTMNPDKK
jgi:hypothetical protein